MPINEPRLQCLTVIMSNLHETSSILMTDGWEEHTTWSHNLNDHIIILNVSTSKAGLLGDHRGHSQSCPQSDSHMDQSTILSPATLQGNVHVITESA